MGYELRRQLREALGPDVTGLQRAVALEIADDANEETRISWVSLEDLARWTGAKDSAVIRNALKRLAAAGWEFRIPLSVAKKDGRIMYAKPGVRMKFRVPHTARRVTATSIGVATAHSEGAVAHSEGAVAHSEGAVAHSEGATATPYSPLGVATAHSEGAVAHSEGATATPYSPLGVATAHSEGAVAHSEGAVAHSEGATATPYSSYPSSPQEEEESSTRGGATATPTAAREITAEEEPEFGRFWEVYPKSRDMDKTKAAWTVAVRKVADPKQITEAAQAYASEVTGSEFRFIKHSANWLREGRYQDKFAPQPTPGQRAVPHAVSSGWAPFKNPDNHDVYDEPLI